MGNSGTHDQPLDLNANTDTFTLGSGGSHCIANGNAAGWAVSNTSNILFVTNNDSVNNAIVYAELVGGTT